MVELVIGLSRSSSVGCKVHGVFVGSLRSVEASTSCTKGSLPPSRASIVSGELGP